MKIKETQFYFKIVDFLLTPIMFIIGGFKKENIQHHHGYHAVNFYGELDKYKVVELLADSPSKYGSSGGFLVHKGLFHMPIFGGWKNYVVLENMDFKDYWFIGWKTGGYFQYSTLSLKQPYVRLLKGRKGSKSYFFGLNSKGQQVKLGVVAHGVLGDKKYPHIPLY